MLTEAVNLTPPGHPDLANQMASLAFALLARFERTGAQADLDRAVEIGKAAVAATPAGDGDPGPAPEQPGERPARPL